ncbi:DUF6884 domain-containing protein [Alkalicoccus daliensis]|uniref:DUF6884 domain-containing protein n=1 Tax=Alkalicoccus daliensis TaxID=745820 RepID=A0A1H0AJB7_9BACI|nr:DUF6884 domain-containing protein [Alkalicoccus daliensis]SDN33650.1 hypothetical protein SAMN04488053_101514 [Alkalicoccus daliensis]
MKTLCIIPCGKKKIWDINPSAGAVQAQHAYVGDLHKKSQAYADVFCSDYRILSAKHGFLGKDDILYENYDVSFNHQKKYQISRERLKDQVKQEGLAEFDSIIALTGRKYIPVIYSVFPETADIQYPLYNQKGIGYILQALAKAVQEEKPLSWSGIL